VLWLMPDACASSTWVMSSDFLSLRISVAGGNFMDDGLEYSYMNIIISSLYK
jgi:hypothetical protein